MAQKYSKELQYENAYRFDTSLLSLPSNKRKYYDFYLDGNIESDNEKLKDFDHKMQIMIKSHDTITGLHIILGNIKYNTFVNAINICYKDSFPHYMFFENNIWYIYKSVEKERKQAFINKKIEQFKIDKNIVLQKEISESKRTIQEKYWGIKRIEIGTLKIQ
jgi:hypothetical protein